MEQHGPADAPARPRFTLLELSGGMGDLGTFLPLVVATAAACRMDMGMILVCAGVMNMVTGLLLRQPIPVQPMKAIAAVAITEALTRGEVAAAGLVMGALMLALALTGLMDAINRVVPREVVMGIQIGVGLKLAAKGVGWLLDLPLAGADSVFMALAVGGVLLLLLWRKWPAALLVFLFGMVLLAVARPEVYAGLTGGLPSVALIWPGGGDWLGGLIKAALPQAPLTVLNSVVAVCALSAAYFPAQGVPPARMAASVGLMNLLCAPLGGVPMCHGSGGLAAQYAFGARTGGSVVMLGTAKAAAGLALGSSLGQLVHAYPAAVLAPLLVLAGVELARAGRASAPNLWAVPLLTAACILVGNTGLGALAGCLAVAARGIWRSAAHDPAGQA